MNRLIIEQRIVQTRKQKQIQHEILICDDYSEGTILHQDISQDKDQSNKFYDDDKNLIRDLLKTYFRDGFGDSITSILDRLVRDEISVRVDDVYYDFDDLKDIIKRIETECI